MGCTSKSFLSLHPSKTLTFRRTVDGSAPAPPPRRENGTQVVVWTTVDSCTFRWTTVDPALQGRTCIYCGRLLPSLSGPGRAEVTPILSLVRRDVGVLLSYRGRKLVATSNDKEMDTVEIGTKLENSGIFFTSIGS